MTAPPAPPAPSPGCRNTIRMGVSWPASPGATLKPSKPDCRRPAQETKRSSPHKSQDSGFSDSGDSEASSPGKVRGSHVTRVYFYCGGEAGEEDHYQSPSSLPVWGCSSSPATGEGRRKRSEGRRKNSSRGSTGGAGEEAVSLHSLLREYTSDGAPYGPDLPSSPSLLHSSSTSPSLTPAPLSSPALSHSSQSSSGSTSCLPASPASAPPR